MRIDTEIQIHEHRLVQIQREVQMIRLAESIRPTRTANPLYRILSQKLLSLMSQLKTKRTAAPEMPVVQNRLLRPE